MARTTLTLSSKNYSSWSLRGWLMTKLAGIDFDEVIVEPNDADARAELDAARRNLVLQLCIMILALASAYCVSVFAWGMPAGLAGLAAGGTPAADAALDGAFAATPFMLDDF